MCGTTTHKTVKRIIDNDGAPTAAPDGSSGSTRMNRRLEMSVPPYSSAQQPGLAASAYLQATACERCTAPGRCPRVYAAAARRSMSTEPSACSSCALAPSVEPTGTPRWLAASSRRDRSRRCWPCVRHGASSSWDQGR